MLAQSGGGGNWKETLFFVTGEDELEKRDNDVKHEFDTFLDFEARQN